MAVASPNDLLLQRATELERVSNLLRNEAKNLRRAVEKSARGRETDLEPLPPELAALEPHTNGTAQESATPASPMPSIEDLALQVAVFLQEHEMLPKEAVPVAAAPQLPLDLEELKVTVYQMVEKDLLSNGELSRRMQEALESLDLRSFQQTVLARLNTAELYRQLAEVLAAPVYKALVEDSNALAAAIAGGYLQRYRIDPATLQEGVRLFLQRKLVISLSED